MRERPCAVTIAGSDSGGGAGIQADLHTFRAFGVHGVSVVTAVTAQNPNEIRQIEPVSARMVRLQLETVWSVFLPRAAKIGMIYDVSTVEAVAEFIARVDRSVCPVVIDPIRLATVGQPLVTEAGWKRASELLFPLASILTPNLDEIEALIGFRPQDLDSMVDAAKRVYDRYGSTVIVKGGHLRVGSVAVDVLFDGQQLELIEGTRFDGIKTHGTGCLFSAALTACLAQGLLVPVAVRRAKEWVARALASAFRCGQVVVLGYDGAVDIEVRSQL